MSLADILRRENLIAFRFVLVNGRVRRMDQHCALCGGIVEESYVRDLQTRLIYCDTQCFAGGPRMAMSATKDRERNTKNRERKVS